MGAVSIEEGDLYDEINDDLSQAFVNQPLPPLVHSICIKDTLPIAIV